MPYNPAFDGARALAVLAVVGFHSRLPLAAGGFIGVDLFFVLSGFLITTILRSEIDRDGSVQIGAFYRRRFLRLGPPLLLMLSGYTAVALMVSDAADVFKDVAIVASYASDYTQAFWRQPEFLSHTWSLAVEAKFYLVWPVVLLAVARLAPRRLGLVLGGCFLLATLWRYFDFYTGLDWYRTYYSFDTRSSGMLLGAAIAAVRWRPAPVVADILGAVGLVGLAVCLWWLRWGTAAAMLHGGLLVDLFAACLILSVSQGGSLAARGLSWPPLVYLGLLSYSIYLWHYPIARALRETYQPPLIGVVVMAASFVLAVLSYELVERPLQNLRKQRLASA